MFCKTDVLQDFSRLEPDEGRGWILWGDRGFVARDSHSGLDLLDQADQTVRASLRLREKFSLTARLKYHKSVKKVSSQSDILIVLLTEGKYFSGFQETRRKLEDDL